MGQAEVIAVIRQAEACAVAAGLVVRVIRRVVGVPGGREVVVPVRSMAWPAVRWSTVRRTTVDEVWLSMVVMSMRICRPRTRIWCLRYSVRSARSAVHGSVPGT
jgi:hypothetical protein